MVRISSKHPMAKSGDFLSGGDGGDVVVDNITLAGNNQSIRYSSSQNLGGFRRTTWDANNNLINTDFPAATTTSGQPFDPAFVTPLILDAIDPTRMLIIGDNGIYESLNQGDTISQLVSTPLGFLQNAGTMGGFDGLNPNEGAFYVGMGSSIWTRAAAGLGAVQTFPGGSQINDVEMNPSDTLNAFAVDQDQVFATVDRGANWIDITGNLLALAGRELRTVTVVPGATDTALVVGASQGVFSMLLSNPGTWAEIGSNLPNVLVYDLTYDAADDILVAGSLGRGAWTFNNASELLVPDSVPTVFLNEFHYDNFGSDTTEFVEVVGTAGTDLSSLSIVLYDGATGQAYDTMPLSGIIDDEGPGFGAVGFNYPTDSIQNGAPDGIALVHNNSTVIEFFSYEGTFTATDGPANGLTSVDVFAFEDDTTNSNESLQRDNTILPPPNIWNGPLENTFGDLNIPSGLDFGDAPSALQANIAVDYPVSLSQDGARHADAPGPRLGALIDYEQDSSNSANADFDDNNGVDDEDGVTLPAIVFASGAIAETGTVVIDLQNADPNSNRLDGLDRL